MALQKCMVEHKDYYKDFLSDSGDKDDDSPANDGKGTS